MGDVTLWILLLVLAVWATAAVVFALGAGRAISTADRKEHTASDHDDRVDLTTLR